MKKLFLLIMAFSLLFSAACAGEASPEALYGFALKIEDDNALKITNARHHEVLVRLPDSMNAADYCGKWLEITYDGIMTKSLPAQIRADSVTVCYVECGVIDSICEGRISLITGERILHVLYDDTTELPDDLKAGESIYVFYDGQMTRSIPAQIVASAIVRVGDLIDGQSSSGD